MIQLLSIKLVITSPTTMTRFQEFLSFGILVLAFWAALLYQVSQWKNPIALLHTQLLPIYGLVIFGAVSASIVLYRVFTFNDCPEANKELQSQIKQAKADLQKKGFIFPKTKAN